MIAALTAGSAVCCFGVAYASHMILPVKPVTPAEILKNQSTLNTLNFLTKDELKTRSIQERIAAYTSSRANLLDVLGHNSLLIHKLSDLRVLLKEQTGLNTL